MYTKEEQRLLALIEHGFDAIALINPVGKILYASPSTKHVLGYEPSEFVGMNGFKLVHPRDLPFVMKSLAMIMRKRGATASVEVEVKRKSGRWIWVEVIGTNLLTDPQVGAIVANFRDITERKQITQERARLASIVDSSDHAIISKTLEGHITSWNKAAEKLFGYSIKEATGKHISIIIPPQLRREEEAITRKLKKGIRIEHIESLRMKKDGSRVHISLSISPIKDSKRNIIGTSDIIRDITERKAIEFNTTFLAEASKILFSSLDYKTTLNNVAKLAVPKIADWCAVYMKKNKGVEIIALAHSNPKQIKVAQELFKKYPTDLNANAGVAGVLKSGKTEFYPVVTHEMIKKTAKNKEHLRLMETINFVSLIICPLIVHHHTAGTIIFVSSTQKKHFTKTDVSVAEELAHRAAIAIENASLYTDAQKAINLRDSFISLASHELKTPVTSLKMYTQALNRQFEKRGDTNLQSYFEKIDQQTDKLTRLVNDLLNVSKIQHGKLEFTFETININEVVKETVDALQEITRKHKIIIEGKIKEKVYADQYRIYQVLTNLLTNAVKYSPHADRIIVRLMSKKDEAVVTVQDFGIGIETNQQDKIFNQFYRVISPEEKTYPGLGMGLFISSEIIKRHGGSIIVESSIGYGSQFSFTLPLLPAGKKKIASFIKKADNVLK